MGPFKTWPLLLGKEPQELEDFVKMTQLECKSRVWTSKNLTPLLSSLAEKPYRMQSKRSENPEKLTWRTWETNMVRRYSQNKTWLPLQVCCYLSHECWLPFLSHLWQSRVGSGHRTNIFLMDHSSLGRREEWSTNKPRTCCKLICKLSLFCGRGHSQVQLHWNGQCQRNKWRGANSKATGEL